ncbi:MAG: hypothetical protein PHU06_13290 [Gallionella sp.]|nr:hypothetical protein [Gallionella sp.]MDD4959747.1 hypothetical protein [Gallionella sp.]
MTTHFDLDFALIEHLNLDAESARIDQAALQQAITAQGEDWAALFTSRCPHIFSPSPVFISTAQLQQMRDIIAAIERVVNPESTTGAKGVFFGYDFHLNGSGAHLIEVNTNAGGAFLNALLLDSQREGDMPGEVVAQADLTNTFLAMFQAEWALARGGLPLRCVAIVDEQPEQQFLYPEFLLAQAMFERAGITAHIVDPSDLQAHDDGLYVADQKIDLVYNRMTDFTLTHSPALLRAHQTGQVVLTPHPDTYARYADKRLLAEFSQPDLLVGVNPADVATLQAGVPPTFLVSPDLEQTLWEQRKNLFFKPNSGYGSKGAYRGDKLTKRVFAEILQSDYVAQQLAPPAERALTLHDGTTVSLKFDVRCYVYDGQIQLIAARLYQGQTTNFRTQGGGFAVVRLLAD